METVQPCWSSPRHTSTPGVRRTPEYNHAIAMKHESQHVPRRIGLILFAALLVGSATPSLAQSGGQVPPPIGGIESRRTPDEDAWEIRQRKELAKKMNLQRQQDIRKDTEKLLELATELKQSVEKSNENTLSLDVIKKADQIEKLAKTVKDKMKGP